MNKESVKFVVIGCGHIGKRHIAMIQNQVEAKLVAVVDKRAPEELGISEIGVPFFYSVDELLASGLTFEVANIAVPNGLHASMALRMLRAGKHVVIEKPMTLSSADAEEIINVSEAVQRHVFVVMQNRYSPPSVWLKELMDTGKLGDIYMVQINCFWNRDQRYYQSGDWRGTKDLDGGTLYTQFSHFIDIMYWVFGDIKNITGRFYDFNHQQMTAFEDSGVLTFEFERGGVGSLSFSTAVWDKNIESSMTVIGSQGSVKIGGQYMDKVEYCHIRDYQMPELPPTQPGNDYGSYKGSAANHVFVIQNVVDVLRNRDTVTTNAKQGATVVRIIEDMYSI